MRLYREVRGRDGGRMGRSRSSMWIGPCLPSFLPPACLPRVLLLSRPPIAQEERGKKKKGTQINKREGKRHKQSRMVNRLFLFSFTRRVIRNPHDELIQNWYTLCPALPLLPYHMKSLPPKQHPQYDALPTTTLLFRRQI